MYGEIILQLIREFQRDFPRKLQHSVGMSVESYKEDFECSFQFRNLRSRMT